MISRARMRISLPERKNRDSLSPWEPPQSLVFRATKTSILVSPFILLRKLRQRLCFLQNRPPLPSKTFSDTSHKVPGVDSSPRFDSFSCGPTRGGGRQFSTQIQQKKGILGTGRCVPQSGSWFSEGWRKTLCRGSFLLWAKPPTSFRRWTFNIYPSGMQFRQAGGHLPTGGNRRRQAVTAWKILGVNTSFHGPGKIGFMSSKNTGRLFHNVMGEGI